MRAFQLVLSVIFAFLVWGLRIIDALREGKVTPLRSEHDDLLVDGTRIQFYPAPRVDAACAKKPATKPANGQDKPREADAPAHMGPGFGKP